MSKLFYKAGDLVAMKDGPARSDRGATRGEVVAVLPATQGAAQYRIRCEGENFERRVASWEIEPLGGSVPVSRSAVPQTGGPGKPWLNTASIKIGK